MGETAVGSANELGQQTVEGLENVGASTGMVNPVSAPSPPIDVTLYPIKQTTFSKHTEFIYHEYCI